MTPLDFRTCKYCADNCLEDELLIHSEWYSDLRFDLFNSPKTFRLTLKILMKMISYTF